MSEEKKISSKIRKTCVCVHVFCCYKMYFLIGVYFYQEKEEEKKGSNNSLIRTKHKGGNFTDLSGEFLKAQSGGGRLILAESRIQAHTRSFVYVCIGPVTNR